jgi:hypothetical protein
MEACSQDQQHANLHAPELNVRTALRNVVQQVAAGCSRTCPDVCSRLLNRAWAILLDLDAADTSQVRESSSNRGYPPNSASCYALKQNSGCKVIAFYPIVLLITMVSLQALAEVPDREQHNRIAAAQVR